MYSVGLGCGMVMCHRFVFGLRCPNITVLSLYFMDADVLVKCAVHPESHSCPMEMRECCRSGKIWDCWAGEGKEELRLTVAVWLDVTVEPSGS